MDTKSYMQAYKKFTEIEKYFKLDEFYNIGVLKD